MKKIPVSSSTKKQLTKQESPKQKPHQQRKFNIKHIIIAFFVGITSSLLVQRYIGHNWQFLASYVFSIQTISNQMQKLTVLKESLILISTLQFLIVMIIMSIRIIRQKISPVNQKDPYAIAVLNRILNNNIEQSLVFFGIYSYLLMSPQINIGQQYILGLPLLFLIGRFLYFVSYFIGSMFNVSSARTLGFAFVFVVGYLMTMEIIFQKSTFVREFIFG